jgi:outer membrane biosynthesis protein TonB
VTAIQPSASRAGVVGTSLAHGTLLALMLLAARSAKRSTSVTYEVNLVAAPLPTPDTRSAAPQATPTAPEEVAPAVKPREKPAPKQPPRPAEAKRAESTPVTKTAVTPVPGEKPSTGQDVVTLHQEGISFPYPEYLAGIENAIYRQWNHAMFRPGLDVKVSFVIMKDGSVDPKSVIVERPSGNFSFDLAARAAIEAANNARGFGPLPTGWSGSSLPILFDFSQVAKSPP